MKHIGIVNVTTVGACICANEIVALASKISRFGEHPEFTLHAFSFSRYREALLREDWEGMAQVILESIEKLSLTGVDFVVIPSNTPHFAIDDIQAKSPVQVLSILEITADECIKRGWKNVAVLGTKFTMLGGLYQKILLEKDVTPVIPPLELCERIDDFIMNEIIPSNIDSQSIESIAHDIRQINCDGIILGCTELPAVFSEIQLGIPVIDTTRLLAQKALEFAV